MDDMYILDGHTPIKTDDHEKFRKLCRDLKARTVAKDIIDDIDISTMFYGFSFALQDKKPILFETQIFGGDFEVDEWHYHTWAEAEAGHKAAMELVRKANNKENNNGITRTSTANSGIKRRRAL